MTKKPYSYDEEAFFVRLIHGKGLPCTRRRAGKSRENRHKKGVSDKKRRLCILTQPPKNQPMYF